MRVQRKACRASSSSRLDRQSPVESLNSRPMSNRLPITPTVAGPAVVMNQFARCVLSLLILFIAAPDTLRSETGTSFVSSNGNRIALTNPNLRVLFDPERPIVLGYEHFPSGTAFGGGNVEGRLAINGEAIPWNEWRIQVETNASALTYRMTLPRLSVSFDYAFSLAGNGLEVELRNIQDPTGSFRSLDWRNLPLLTCADPSFQFWSLTTGAPDSSSGGKMWTSDRSGLLSNTAPVKDFLIRGCLYHPQKVCVFVDGNYPLLPTTGEINGAHEYRLSLNTYQYRVRSKTMPPLKAQVVFLQDENGDGLSDLSDYCLWTNRRLPEPDPIYRTCLWYKIFMDLPATGVRTTCSQAEEIVRAIHNVTDGLPQLVYLVGWQYEGHDTGYPAMDKVNERIGGASALRSLVENSHSRYNTLISYHCNIDDTYTNHAAHDPSLLADNGNLSHCLDAESGKIFQRLEALMRTVPVQKTIHFDNTRITSPVRSQGIGILEELEAGIRPVDQFLKARGITMTTEGQNGIPIDCTDLFSAFWHYDTPLPTVQLWHRKILGGGWGGHVGPQNRYQLGLGGSIHQDVSYKAIDRDALGEKVWREQFSWVQGSPGMTVSYEKDWDDLVQRIYLGGLLYQFYLEREMTLLRRIPGGVRQEYGNHEVLVENASGHLTVKWGDVLVAEDDDRFIPRDGSVYAYSLGGCSRSWKLPVALRGRKLQVHTLTREGRAVAPPFTIDGDSIRLTLPPKSPVKISVSTS
jgi:Endo-alpha-N-acetylgalactosaminidase